LVDKNFAKEQQMPFYIIDEMKKRNPKENPNMILQELMGEYMKAGIVTKPEGEGSGLHMHPNEEQWTLVLDGKLHYILDDEDRIVEKGDLIHIPRHTHHRSRSIGGSATFFTVKSPAGDGDLNQDYTKVDEEKAAAAEQRYEEVLKNFS
jgi:quercetin dioxygenase-like cupin family protein